MSVSNLTISAQTIKSVGRIQTDISPIAFDPLDWLKDAKIYNKKWEQVPSEWIKDNADIIVLLYTANGVDRNNVLKKFYHIYESTKYSHHMPIDVIFLPMDETEEDAIACFEEQANWFTLRHDDILIPTLKFMYGITCIPHLTVFKTNCEVISYNGIADIDLYDKNAVISWLTVIPSTRMQRRRSEVADMYGPVWKYVKQEETLAKFEYHKRFNADGLIEDRKIDPNAIQVPYVPKKYGESAKDDSKPTEVQLKTESEVQLSDTPPKPLAIQLKPSKLAIPNAQHFSKSAAALSQSDHSKSAHSNAGLHVHLPEDISSPTESRGNLSENRSKYAVTQVSESTADLKRARSGLAHAEFSESPSQIPDNSSKLAIRNVALSENRKENRSHLLASLSKSAVADDASKSAAQLGIPRSKSGNEAFSEGHSAWSESRARLTEGLSKSAIDGASKSAVQLHRARSKSSHGGFSEGHSKTSESHAQVSGSRFKSAQ